LQLPCFFASCQTCQFVLQSSIQQLICETRPYWTNAVAQNNRMTPTPASNPPTRFSGRWEPRDSALMQKMLSYKAGSYTVLKGYTIHKAYLDSGKRLQGCAVPRAVYSLGTVYTIVLSRLSSASAPNQPPSISLLHYILTRRACPPSPMWRSHILFSSPAARMPPH
jgi:hypothetical protein